MYMFAKEIIRYIAKELLYIPGKAEYHVGGIINDDIKSRCRLLPCTAHSGVFWTKLENIKYNGLIEVSRQGKQFCSGDNWEFPKKHVRPSIFDSISEDVYRWQIYETVRMIFIEGKSHTLTPQYESIITQLESRTDQKAVWGCKNREDVDDLFNGMKITFENMSKNGYKTQAELGKYNRDEIQLYITENGELLKGIGGSHRILMAEILGVEQVAFVIHGASIEFVIDLCKEMDLPPHQAITRWNKSNTRIHDHR